VPELQTVHVAQVAAFMLALNVPVLQPVQTRLTEGDPGVEAKVPAAQLVHAVQLC